MTLMSVVYATKQSQSDISWWNPPDIAKKSQTNLKYLDKDKQFLSFFVHSVLKKKKTFDNIVT